MYVAGAQNGDPNKLLYNPPGGYNPLNQNVLALITYWLRLTTDGSQVFGTVWPADGVTPESSALRMEWARGDRSGLAGISAASNGGALEMSVDYILIQADGLPTTVVGIPEPSSIVLSVLGLVGLIACTRRRRGRRIS